MINTTQMLSWYYRNMVYFRTREKYSTQRPIHLDVAPSFYGYRNFKFFYKATQSLFWNSPAKGEKSSTQRPIHLNVAGIVMCEFDLG